MSDPVRQELLDIFVSRATKRYGLSAINQLQHALQAAALAEADSAPPATVLASLLHDVGHLLHDLPEDVADQDVDTEHESLGSAWLSQYFGPEVSNPVRLHVAAKRYLCATEADYFGKLSAASVHSLGKQGGPMSAAEVTTFAALPHAKAAARLRRWDDGGKVDGLHVPDLMSYRERIARFML